MHVSFVQVCQIPCRLCAAGRFSYADKAWTRDYQKGYVYTVALPIKCLHMAFTKSQKMAVNDKIATVEF
jgi:hypothetical protein